MSNEINVGELKKILETLPDDAAVKVLEERTSGFSTYTQWVNLTPEMMDIWEKQIRLGMD